MKYNTSIFGIDISLLYCSAYTFLSYKPACFIVSNIKCCDCLKPIRGAKISGSTSSGKQQKLVDDFIHHGACIATSEMDLWIKKAKAWEACHKLRKI